MDNFTPTEHICMRTSARRSNSDKNRFSLISKVSKLPSLLSLTIWFRLFKKSGCINVCGDTFTAIRIVEKLLCHCFACSRAASRAQYVYSSISPFYSSTGINIVGGTLPLELQCQRPNASAAIICPLLVFIFLFD